jgi:hypothetical protein
MLSIVQKTGVPGGLSLIPNRPPKKFQSPCSGTGITIKPNPAAEQRGNISNGVDRGTRETDEDHGLSE